MISVPPTTEPRDAFAADVQDPARFGAGRHRQKLSTVNGVDLDLATQHR